MKRYDATFKRVEPSGKETLHHFTSYVINETEFRQAFNELLKSLGIPADEVQDLTATRKRV